MMLHRRSFLLALFAVAALLALPFAPARAQNAVADAPAYVQELGATALATLAQADISAPERAARFRELLLANFDVATVGRFVLGRYWNVATPEQQQEYLRLFESMLVDIYAHRFGEYSGETFEVGAARPEGERDVLVTSRIVRPSGPPVKVDWRLRPQEGGSFQIIDVIVEGVSMATTQRSDFASIIQRGGGRIEALLEALRKRQG